MKTLFKILTLTLLVVFQVALAQQVVSGTVTDQDGMPLPGATVVIKGTNTATSADFDGNYTIAAKNGDVLVVSYVGYSSFEVSVNGSTANASLSNSNELDEVVVTGYSETTKAKSTNSSVKITAETINNRPNASLIQTLTGQVAGLDISTNSGAPGANSLIELRGTNSINGNTEPLLSLIHI